MECLNMELKDSCSQVENKTPGEKNGFRNEFKDAKHGLKSEPKSAYEKLSSNPLLSSAAVEFKTIETGKNKCCSFNKQQKILPWVEKFFLISICVALAGGFSVPIIMYAVSADDSPAGNTTTSCDNSSYMAIPQVSTVKEIGDFREKNI